MTHLSALNPHRRRNEGGNPAMTNALLNVPGLLALAG